MKRFFQNLVGKIWRKRGNRSDVSVSDAILKDMRYSVLLVRKDVRNLRHFFSLRDAKDNNIILDTVMIGYLMRGFQPVIAVAMAKYDARQLDIPESTIQLWYADKWSRSVHEGYVDELVRGRSSIRGEQIHDDDIFTCARKLCVVF